MPNLKEAIKKEAQEKNILIQDDRTAKVYNLFNELFSLKPNREFELEFERLLLNNRAERAGLHTSAIIASDNYYCQREQVLSLVYKSRDMGKVTPPGTLRIFEEGNYVHRKWQRLFIRGGLAKPQDLDHTSFNHEYYLGYSPDAIITINGKQYIVEVKSMNEFAYKKATNHPSAEKQLMMYMFLSGINNGIVLMENKNNQEFKLTCLDFDVEKITEYIQRLDFVKDAYESKKMPERRPDCKTRLCKRCQECAMLLPCWGTPEDRRLLKIGNNTKIN